MGATGDYDYVIVGAGSSGAVLAHRLSADSDRRVCLIEAGPTDRSPLIRVPLGVMVLAKDRRHNWLYTSAPQAGLNGRTVSIPRGKVLGGSSAINGMIYIRGHRADYDGWAELGCTGWDYESILPYFRRSEANADPARSDTWHGREGPLWVSNLQDASPVDRDFMAAAGELQVRECADFNAAEPEGVGIYQVTQKDGKRHSTAEAFLNPIRGRRNLDIVTGADVESIELHEGRAVAVRARRADGSAFRVACTGEIVLSAGAIGSPDLLLRSGIGPAAEIAAWGGVPRVDLPGVGRNLQDHVDCMVICRSRSRRPYGISLPALPRRALDLLNWVTRHRGMLSSNMVEAGGFVRSSPAEDRPDIQFHIIPGLKSHRGRMVEWGHGVSLHTCVLRPESRGSVTRNAPTGRPVVDLGLLRDDADLDRLARGVALAREILRQGPMARHGLTEVVPGAAVTTEAELRDYIRAQARTVYHPVGTCAMGVGPDAVVDPELRVRGVAGLRVVDASIMPRIVSGNTNAPAIMIAEKASDMIRAARREGRARAPAVAAAH
ncbi:MAG TPA: GMC family oxidoreductase N-terminal domain-containing protein [Pararhodobacter sp.]|uniref:GMC family oxidoreductase n=1 Tax=Pararhodobacter sp. TaxID=2127056 RepID=UPI001DD0FD00|nr:GMC family oxidoreductase N-terminal domain-containing protein [Pararhodobacter sp.]MCB1343975.1 GMC family oxidoreductase N-terminal domain-containing protein [Paracoccaceae bacterium]HPD92830.1 GMC family oxidoreductase N-terminal domain-containing protein [Pararhodobacter sp.]